MKHRINTQSKTITHAIVAPFLMLISITAGAGIVLPPGPSLPIHSLIQELEGDYSDLGGQDGKGGPNFGFSVAMHGDTLVVGAPGTRVGGISNRGAVFIFRRQSGQWQLTQRLLPGLGVGSDHCGYAVAVDQFNVLIGCPHHEPVSGQQRGRAVLYTRANPADAFVLSTPFTDSGDATGSLCGRAVALLGAAESGIVPLAAVSCPGRGFDIGGGLLSRPGAVDLYRFFLDSWQLAATTVPQGVPPMSFTNYGQSIHLSNHSGASFNDIMLTVGRPDTANGQVLIYQMGDTINEWNLDQTYNGTSSSQLGYSVHMLHDRLVAGAPTRSVSIPDGQGGFLVIPVGSLHTAQRGCTFNPFPDPPDCAWSASTTEIVGSVTSAIQVEQNRLGHAVHVLASGGLARIIAGEPLWPLVNSFGRARHYHREGSDWTLNEGEPFYNTAMPIFSRLGTAFASGDGWLAIGASTYVGTNQTHVGRVFMYAYDHIMFSDRFEQ